MGIRVAFYKASGKIGDKLIRLWTGGPYSHCEVVMDGMAYSASQYHNAVRAWHFQEDHNKWDIVELDSLDENIILTFFRNELGKKYDWLGIFLSQLFPFQIHNKSKWFCSEICHEALVVGGLKSAFKSQEVDPNTLYKILTSKEV